MINEEVLREAIKLRAENARMTFRQIAEQLLGDADYAGALRKLVMDQQRGSEVAMAVKELRKLLPEPESDFLWDVTQLPPQFHMNLPYSSHAEVNSAIIISDLHCPHVDKDMIHAIMEDSRINNIDTLIIAGDIIDGQFTGKHKNPAEYTASSESELQYMRHYLKYFESMFSEVYICPGNHDEWVMNYFEMSFKEIIDTILGEHNLIISPYEYLTVNDNIVVGHLEEWNETPGLLAWKIAKQFKRHAIVGHDHIRGMYTENNSKLYGVSLGACIVPANIYYKRASFNSFPAFQNGYAVLENKNSLRLMSWDGKKTAVEKTLILGSTQ
jgi:predicted phosphodiesterase